MMAPLAVQLVLSRGESGASARSGVEAIIMWFAGELVGAESEDGTCGMQGCSRARMKSIAISRLESRGGTLVLVAEEYGFGILGDGTWVIKSSGCSENSLRVQLRRSQIR